MAEPRKLKVKFQESGGGWGNPLMGRVFDSDEDLADEERVELAALIDRCELAHCESPGGAPPTDVAEFQLKIDTGKRQMTITGDMVRADEKLRELVSFVRRRGRQALLEEPAGQDAAVAAVFFDLGDTLVRSSPRAWIPGAKETLATLGESPVRLGVLSNTDPFDRVTIAPHLPDGFDFAAFENALIVLSGEVGVQKPDPKIFVLAVEKSGLPASQCLYASENADERQVAESIGMQSHAIAGPEDLQQLLTRLLPEG